MTLQSVLYVEWALTFKDDDDDGHKFLATLVALHFTLVSRSVPSVAVRLEYSYCI